MSSMPKIRVVPVRGSDWLVSGSLRNHGPEPFTVALRVSDPDHWEGIVLDSGHEFEGRQVDMLRRHTGGADEVEVTVAPPESDQATSFGWAVFDPPLRSI